MAATHTQLSLSRGGCSASPPRPSSFYRYSRWLSIYLLFNTTTKSSNLIQSLVTSKMPPKSVAKLKPPTAFSLVVVLADQVRRTCVLGSFSHTPRSAFLPGTGNSCTLCAADLRMLAYCGRGSFLACLLVMPLLLMVGLLPQPPPMRAVAAANVLPESEASSRPSRQELSKSVAALPLNQGTQYFGYRRSIIRIDDRYFFRSLSLSLSLSRRSRVNRGRFTPGLVSNRPASSTDSSALMPSFSDLTCLAPVNEQDSRGRNKVRSVTAVPAAQGTRNQP